MHDGNTRLIQSRQSLLIRRAHFRPGMNYLHIWLLPSGETFLARWRRACRHSHFSFLRSNTPGMCRGRRRTLTAAISASKAPEIPVFFWGFFFFALFTGKRCRCFPPLRWDERRQQLDKRAEGAKRIITLYSQESHLHPAEIPEAPGASFTPLHPFFWRIRKNPDIRGWGASFFHANLLLSAPTTRLWFAKAAPAGAVSSSPRGSARAQRRICISA